MADSVVSFLLENLTQLLSQESKLLGGVKDQVRLLHNELRMINVFLQNTEGKRHENDLVKEVVSQIRDVAYEAEDVVDIFIMTVTQHRIRNKLMKVIHSFDRASTLHEVAKKIETIKIAIKEIYDNRSKYGVERAESSGGDVEAEEILHRRRRYVEQDHVVGFKLKAELLHGLEAKYNSNKDKLKGTIIEDLKGIKEMNDAELKNALNEFVEGLEDHKLKSSLSSLVRGFGAPPDKIFLEWLCKSNKLVRVIELRNMGICCLMPNQIENLIHLRYLSIGADAFCVIPDSICNLWNLETLDMRNSIIECLPEGIWRLHRLRHLYLGGLTSLPRTNNKVALPSLQVLSGLAINQGNENILAKARFPYVRKLGLFSLNRVESGLFSSLHPLRHLQTLKIHNHFKLSSPISFQLSLTKITLVHADLSPAIMRVLGSLTNLRILKVVRPIHQITLSCDENSFCQLLVFKMANVHVLKWNMGKGAMPSLQRLVIERCQFAYMPPDELRCLTALRDVEVLYPSQKLAKMLQQLQMRNGCNVQVYPLVETN
ncbi:putative disease resistance protein [Quercus suber]|uniref:Disease resistance protein n=1 Tax=Quercus suber TaxID=58331 RepID=A0AAW0M781_QUESU